MTTLYKLANADRTTRGGMTWGPRGFRPPRLSGEGGLCGPGWYHAYDHPLLAALHQPMHCHDYTRMFEVEVDPGDIGRLDGQMKVGFRAGVVGDDVPVPTVTTEQRVRYAIGCGLSVVNALPGWARWANGWLSGEDRSIGSADAAWAAADEAWAARSAARSAAEASRLAWATAAAEVAAWSAAMASAEVAKIAVDIDLLKIAIWAISDKKEFDL